MISVNTRENLRINFRIDFQSRTIEEFVRPSFTSTFSLGDRSSQRYMSEFQFSKTLPSAEIGEELLEPEDLRISIRKNQPQNKLWEKEKLASIKELYHLVAVDLYQVSLEARIGLRMTVQITHPRITAEAPEISQRPIQDTLQLDSHGSATFTRNNVSDGLSALFDLPLRSSA